MNPQYTKPRVTSARDTTPISPPRRASTLPVRFEDSGYHPRSARVEPPVLEERNRQRSRDYVVKVFPDSSPYGKPARGHGRRERLSSIRREIRRLNEQRAELHEEHSRLQDHRRRSWDVLSRSSSSVNDDAPDIHANLTSDLSFDESDDAQEDSEPEIYEFSIPQHPPDLKESIRLHGVPKDEESQRSSSEIKLPKFATVQRIQRSEYTDESLIGGSQSARMFIDNATSASRPLFRWM